MSNYENINEPASGKYLSSNGDPFENKLVGLFVDPRAGSAKSAVRRVALPVGDELFKSMTAESTETRLAIMAFGITQTAVHMRKIYSGHLLAGLAVCPGITIPDSLPSDLTLPQPLVAQESWVFSGKSLPINITEAKPTDDKGWVGHIIGASEEVLEAGREHFPLRSVVGSRMVAALPHPMGSAALQDIRRVVYADGVYIGMHVDANSGATHEQIRPYPGLTERT